MEESATSEQKGSPAKRFEEFENQYQGNSKRAVDAWFEHVADQANRLDEVEEKEKILDKLDHAICEIDLDLADVESGVPKAKGMLCALADTYDYVRDPLAFEAMSIISNHVSSNVIERVVSNWKKEWRSAVKRRKKDEWMYQRYGEPQIFWEATRPMESAIDVSRYRLIEKFQLGEFEPSKRGIEAKYSPESISDLDLWFLSRSPSLCARIRQAVEVTLNRICKEEWTGRVEEWGGSLITPDAELLPDYRAIALKSCCVLKLSRKQGQREKAQEAVKWLAREQQSDGSWFDFSILESGEISKQKHLLTNLFAAEAIRVSGLDKLKHTLNSVESWILSQQHTDGSWNGEKKSHISKKLGYIGKTALVVDYFENGYLRRELNNYLDVARDFISRSKEFASEDNTNSHRLAILTAYQGIEALLYGCLSSNAVSMSVYDSRENRTIGVKSALRKLQQFFQEEKIIDRSQDIEYKSQVDRLKHLRDEIVHKANVVGEKDVQELTMAAGRFANLSCQRVFGHSLIQ